MSEYSERKQRAIDAVLSSRRLTDSRSRYVLGESYDLTYEYFAPFIVEIADRMLVDMSSMASFPRTKRSTSLRLELIS